MSRKTTVRFKTNESKIGELVYIGKNHTCVVELIETKELIIVPYEEIYIIDYAEPPANINPLA